ncbi:MAG TPA: class I SAM-dependent methyltransferase [Gammaproteobacteria bacterium]
MSSPLSCPLCAGAAAEFCADRRRRFYRCDRCELVFADPASHLDTEGEKAVYDLHCNDPADARYRTFLARLSEPLCERLRPGMQGLDYGCGPGPTLGLMLREAGMHMCEYDPVYRPDETVLQRQYDFVTCTEVVEHFRDPGADWPRLARLVRPGGWLGVMTWLMDSADARAFHTWGYKGDPTHVAFYSPATLEWLGRELGFEVWRLDERVILMRRTTGAQGAG